MKLVLKCGEKSLRVKRALQTDESFIKSSHKLHSSAEIKFSVFWQCACIEHFPLLEGEMENQ